MSEQTSANQCEAITRRGTRCLNSKIPGSMFCYRHALPSRSVYTEGKTPDGKFNGVDEELETKEELDAWETPNQVELENIDLTREAALWPRGRDLQRDEIALIIEEHTLWRQSKGEQGKRGDLSYVNIIMQNADNFWFPYGNLRGVRFMGSSLKNAVLSNSDLRGASFNDTDLRDASLSDADLRGAYLRNSKLAGAYLDNADFRGAVMDGAMLESEDKSPEEIEQEQEELQSWLDKSDDDIEIEKRRPPASMDGTSLQNAILSGARLSDVTGLQPENLAGTDLTGAKLPPEIAKFELLSSIADISKAASTTHLTMIGACFYSMITVATSNLDTLSKSTALTKLPILGTEIPITTFFIASPFVLLGVYVYFHMYLLRLWELLGTLPALFPDGRALDEKSYPWLLTSLVRLYVPLLRKQRKPLWWLQVAISITTAWILVPGTILLFMIPFLKEGQWMPTTVIALLLTSTMLVGISTMALARNYLAIRSRSSNSLRMRARRS